MHLETVPISHRLQAVNRWNSFSQQFDPESQKEAAVETLALLDLAVSRSSSLETQCYQLSGNELIQEAKEGAVVAAAVAIKGRELPLAAALLEQGRAFIFSQLVRHRTAIDKLRKEYPDLSYRFAQLSRELEGIVIRGDHETGAQTPEDLATKFVLAHRCTCGFLTIKTLGI